MKNRYMNITKLLISILLIIILFPEVSYGSTEKTVITPNGDNPSAGGWSKANTTPFTWWINFTDKADMYLGGNNILENIATGFWWGSFPNGNKYPIDDIQTLEAVVDINVIRADYSDNDWLRYAIDTAVVRNNGPLCSNYSVIYTELDFWDSPAALHHPNGNINQGGDTIFAGGNVVEYKIDNWENRPLNQWKHYHIDFLPYINSTLKTLCNGVGIQSGDKLESVYVVIETNSSTTSEILVANFSAFSNGYCSTLNKKIANAMGATCGSANWDSAADVNKDGKVDVFDSTISLQNSDNEIWCYEALNSITDCKTDLTQSVTPASGTATGSATPTFICSYTSSGTPVTGATVNVTILSRTTTTYPATYSTSGDYRYSGVTLYVGLTSWYCNASKSGYQPQSGPSQTFFVNAYGLPGGSPLIRKCIQPNGCGPYSYGEEIPEQTSGDTWTFAVVIIALLGLGIGYFILKEALFTATTRKPKNKRR
jgi:hypothetical protein